MANHLLQFGSGKTRLPEPWQNLDESHDIRKKLRFDDDSARFIFAEHVIEHVSFHQGLFFLTECYRVLSVGGVLRVSFPDVVRVSHAPHKWSDAYMARLKDKGEPIEGKLSPGKVTMLLSAGWGHQMAWTEALMFLELLAVGFRRVCPLEYSKSQYQELTGIDSHHLEVGRDLALLETTIVEATK
jgi:hypothetical protein